MPRTSEMRESKFLKQADVGNGALMTVESCDQYNVAKEGAEPEHKWCLVFAETDKPLVLNSTNIQLCERIFGSDNTDEWVGKKLVVYTDPTVSYGGKITGGVRVRAPKQPAKTTAKPIATPVTEELEADDVPF